MAIPALADKFIKVRKYKRYLEIGICHGSGQDKVSCSIRDYDKPDNDKSASVESAAAFIGDLGDYKVDIVFVDGKHECDNVMSDIVSSLSCLSPGGVILVHDCLPRTARMADHTQQSGEWCGDGFRAIAKYFSESPYFCYTVDLDTGFAVIDTAGKPVRKYEFKHDSMLDLSFDAFYMNRVNILGVVSEKRADALISRPDIATASEFNTPRVLFVTRASGIDYQADCLFNGIVGLGIDVTDSKYLWYLSRISDDKKHGLYGKGFSIAGKLPDRSSIPRDDEEIKNRIRDKYYDAIVYGSIHRCSDYMDIVSKTYDRERVAIVDGEDRPTINDGMLVNGVYFKRELIPEYSGKAIPISFAVPDEQFKKRQYGKTRDFAAQVPGIPGVDHRTPYHYDNEDEYYRGYSESRFAVTFKKGGWDCLRHYEIVAAGSVPFFPDIDYCPTTTMVNWPKRLQKEANSVAYGILGGRRDDTRYNRILEEFRTYGAANLTTTALAKYVLSRIGVSV